MHSSPLPIRLSAFLTPDPCTLTLSFQYLILTRYASFTSRSFGTGMLNSAVKASDFVYACEEVSMVQSPGMGSTTLTTTSSFLWFLSDTSNDAS